MENPSVGTSARICDKASKMNMKIMHYSALAALLVSGCSTTSQMPDDKYRQFSNFAGLTQKCFEGDHISPQMYAETKNAFNYLLSTWSYDNGKMQSMLQSAYSSASPSKASCRQMEADAHQMIVIANKNMTDKKETHKDLNEAVQEFNRSMSTNKPIYCNKIGNMTMCN